MLDRDAQADESVVGQAAQLHEHGVRVRTLSLFYEQWLAKLPVTELERVSLMFDIGEVHRLRYSRVSRVLDLVVAAVGFVVLLADRAVRRGSGTRSGQSRPAVLPAGSGSAATAGSSRSSSSAPCVSPPATGKLSGPRSTIPGSHGSVGSSGERHLDELPQVLNILRATCRWSGHDPSSPATWPS